MPSSELKAPLLGAPAQQTMGPAASGDQADNSSFCARMGETHPGYTFSLALVCLAASLPIIYHLDSEELAPVGFSLAFGSVAVMFGALAFAAGHCSRETRTCKRQPREETSPSPAPGDN